VASAGPYEATDGAVSAGAAERTRSGRSRDGASAASGQTADGAVSTGAADCTRSGRLRNGAGAGSGQATDGAVSTGAGDRTRSGGSRDGACAGSNQAARDARPGDDDVAARLRAGDDAADCIGCDQPAGSASIAGSHIAGGDG